MRASSQDSELRKQIAAALSDADLHEVEDGIWVRRFAAKSPMALAFADAALGAVAPMLEGLRAELANAADAIDKVAEERDVARAKLEKAYLLIGAMTLADVEPPSPPYGGLSVSDDEQLLSMSDTMDALEPIVNGMVDTQYELERKLKQQVDTRMHETREMDKLRTSLGVLLGFEEGRSLPVNAELVSQLADRIAQRSA